MTVTALPGRSWSGKVDYIYPVLDASTRTLRVRVRFDNPDFLLKPNMYVRNCRFMPQRIKKPFTSRVKR